VREAILKAQPDAMIHQATALASARFGRNLDRTFGPTNRLRTEGTDNLLAAARAAGVRRIVGQSFAPYRYARESGWIKTEDDPLDPHPATTASRTNAAMRYLENAVTDAGGVALRYGGFYGDATDALLKPVRKRMFPIVGDGGGVMSFVHLDDAAAATVLALEHDGAGIYNVVDDEPAPLRDWLPVLASALGGQAAPAHPQMARATDRRRKRSNGRNRGPRCLECQSQTGARLDTVLPQLATRVHGRLRVK
jgi:nucleoside-diphosphate-sugar epimerase